MSTPIIDRTDTAAPLMARSRFVWQVKPGVSPFDYTGENRLGFGAEAVNGFITTGCEAHAAVRMHATPAIGSPWSYDQKGKSVATTSSAGKLRRS